MTTITQRENRPGNRRLRSGFLIAAAFVAIAALILWQLGSGMPAADRPATGEQPGTPREIWAGQNIDSYRFDLEIGCFCLREMTRPVTIEVVDGNVASITYLDDGTAADPQVFTRFATIDQLFERLAEKKAENPVKFDVTYDETNGIPLTATIDVSEMIADEELWLTVSNFESLE